MRGSLYTASRRLSRLTTLSSLVSSCSFSRTLRVYGLAGARGGICFGAIQPLRDKCAANICSTCRTILLPASTPSPLPTLPQPPRRLPGLLEDRRVDRLCGIRASSRRRPQCRVIVVVVHHPDGMFSLDLRTSCMVSLVMKGLESGTAKAVEVKEMLDYLSGKYNNGTNVERRPVEFFRTLPCKCRGADVMKTVSCLGLRHKHVPERSPRTWAVCMYDTRHWNITAVVNSIDRSPENIGILEPQTKLSICLPFDPTEALHLAPGVVRFARRPKAGRRPVFSVIPWSVKPPLTIQHYSMAAYGG